VTTTRLARESLACVVALRLVVVADGWWTRALRNPDGAACLDLADAVRRGEWGARVPHAALD